MMKSSSVAGQVHFVGVRARGNVSRSMLCSPSESEVGQCRRDDATLRGAVIRRPPEIDFRPEPRIQPCPKNRAVHGHLGQEPVMADPVEAREDVALQDLTAATFSYSAI